MTPSTDHPTPAALAAHALGRGSGPEEDARVAAHLEAGCPRCVERLRGLLSRREPEVAEAARSCLQGLDPPPPALFGDLVRRLAGWDVLLEAEGRVADGLLAELLAVPARHRPEEIRLRPRYQCLGLARLLTRRARREVFHDPSRAEHFGRLAVDAAETLEAAGYPGTLAADAQALAWGALGNALRVQSDLFEAERALLAARRHLARGSGWPEDHVEVLSLLGSLRISQARFDRAIRVLEEALEIAEAVGDRRAGGKLRMQMAKAVGEASESARAVDLLGEAAPLLQTEADRTLYLEALQGRASFLAKAGRPGEARKLFDSIEPEWYERLPGFGHRQRLRWVGAQIAHLEGDIERAEEELLAVRAAFADAGQAYDHALVSLELATLYLEEGRTAEVKRLAEELLPAFTSREVHRHAAQAVALFRQAAAAEEATASRVREIARYLRHARGNPYLRFAPAG